MLRRLWNVIMHSRGDFLSTAPFLIAGGVIAALFHSLIPRTVIASFSGTPFLAIAFMMVLAILLSVCSEADSFVAASFVAFPGAALLGFVSIGPVVDLKLIAMYGTSLRRRAAVIIVMTALVTVYALSVLVHLFFQRFFSGGLF